MSLERAVAENLVLAFPWHNSPHLMVALVLPDHGAVFLPDDFMDDFITGEGESCLLFERKGTIQTFCEG